MYAFQVSTCQTSLSINCNDFSSFLAVLEREWRWNEDMSNAQLFCGDNGYAVNADDFDKFCRLISQTPPRAPIFVQFRLHFEIGNVPHMEDEKISDVWVTDLDDFSKALDQIAPCDRYQFEASVNGIHVTSNEELKEIFLGDGKTGYTVSFSNVTLTPSFQRLKLNAFFDNWDNQPYNLSASLMKELVNVPRGDPEWTWVIGQIQHGGYNEMIKIERVQNAEAYNEYWMFCEALVEKGVVIDERWVFHGTRQNQPALIWEGRGFDITKARTGGCLWFSSQSSYSMGSFKHPASDGNSQVFLCCVACGDPQTVKFRSATILNVFANNPTYPGYLLTYK